jgi:hypothetical protein
MALVIEQVTAEQAEAIKSIPASPRNPAAVQARMNEYDQVIDAIRASESGTIRIALGADDSDESKRKITNRLNRAATRNKTAVKWRVDGDFLFVWIDETGAVAEVTDPETGEVEKVIVPVRERRKKPKAEAAETEAA